MKTILCDGEGSRFYPLPAPKWNKSDLFPEDGSGSGEESGEPNVPRFDISRCGVFPACRAGYDTVTKQPTVTCDRNEVSAVLAATCAFIVAIVLSNLLVVVVIARTRSLRKPQGYFKLSLASSGLIYAGVYLTSIAYNLRNKIFYDARDLVQLLDGTERRPFSQVLNERFFTNGSFPGAEEADSEPAVSVAFAVVGVFSSVVTIFSLLLLAADGFMCVQWPIRYRSGDLMTRKRALLALIVAWVAAFACAMLPVFATNAFSAKLLYPAFMYMPLLIPQQVGDKSSAEGISRYWHGITYAVLVYGVPLASAWTLTLLMARRSRALLRQMRNVGKLTSVVQQSADRITYTRVERDLNVTIVAVLSVVTVTLLPIFGVIVAIAAAPPGVCFTRPVAGAMFASLYLFSGASALNVAVYNTCNREFRDATRKLLLDVAHRALFCRAFDSVLPYYRSSRSKSFSTTTTLRVRKGSPYCPASPSTAERCEKGAQGAPECKHGAGRHAELDGGYGSIERANSCDSVFR